MTTWTARVEWTGEAGDQHYDTLTESLQPYAASVGAEREPGRHSATLTVDAATLRQATDLALRAVRDALHAAGLSFHPAGVEVIDEAIAAARLDRPSIPDLVGYAEIADMADVSRQRARELADLPGFPPPVAHLRHAGPLRVRAQVQAWLAQWERKIGRPRKTA